MRPEVSHTKKIIPLRPGASLKADSTRNENTLSKAHRKAFQYMGWQCEVVS